MNPKESDHFTSKSTATNDQPIPKKIDNLNYGKTNFIEKNYSTIIDIDKAIIVSDVHLGYEKSNVTAFLDFLTTNIANGTSKDHSIFILGDLWDFLEKARYYIFKRI
jgi:hypothetical protein